ncbi:lysosomal Pro-X carboxypeptidase [Achlya hypogyna]|uniref:Lysosomal Pro-X carboxypeptidase n=1 Tax=Achlya hypogyna TaxID=1202772 RepID=A0A1V9Y9W0_ACHHY|nr:lysosomal Pro-X carboxypeptidase [Achlya hypogyna]
MQEHVALLQRPRQAPRRHIQGLILLACFFVASVVRRQTEYATSLAKGNFSGDLRARCSQHVFVQRLDHFQAANGTYEQRYFVCQEYWTNRDGPIFFYTGNEANVELYLNHTGLMWESASAFNAMLVFAEHRYFGASMPPQAPGSSLGEFALHLSSQQALADFAELIAHLKQTLPAPKAPVIAFGGSYGGMLAAWLRLKYPHMVQGAIAASAPMRSFLGLDPPMDLEAFARVVTHDASAAAGAAPNCARNIRATWQHVFALGATDAGRQSLQKIFRLCPGRDVSTPESLYAFATWAKEAYENMAMGNYPYPTSYITGGDRVLPAFPMRAACVPFSGLLSEPVEYLKALKQSIDVYYNTTGKVKCYAFDDDESLDYWDYLNCADMYSPQDQTGVDDMFWTELHNITTDNNACQRQWGVSLRPFWPSVVFGGADSFRLSSNIVFSNGDFDPWYPTGFTTSLSDTVVAIMIHEGAHHLDLMFSHPLDTRAVKRAREVELDNVRKWIAQYKATVQTTP